MSPKLCAHAFARRIESKEGIAPSSALRSRTSPITGMRLQHAMTTWLDRHMGAHTAPVGVMKLEGGQSSEHEASKNSPPLVHAIADGDGSGDYLSLLTGSPWCAALRVPWVGGPLRRMKCHGGRWSRPS